MVLVARGGGCWSGACIGTDGGAFLPAAMACATTLVVCGGGLAVGVSSSSSSTGMGGGAFLGMGLISMPPPPQHACWMILAIGDAALGGGERGCLLCGDGCRVDVGGNFAGAKGGDGALAAGCAVSPLPKEGADVDPDDADVAVVTLGPDKVGVGDDARVGVAGLYPLRALGDRPLPVLRPAPPRVTLVSATRVDVLLVLGRCCPLGPTHAKNEGLGRHDVPCGHGSQQHVGAGLACDDFKSFRRLDVMQDDPRALIGVLEV